MDGIDCKCAARSENECGCGADWTTKEVFKLRQRVAELETVLRECREALIPHMAYVLPEILNHPAQCVNKIDEVLK